MTSARTRKNTEHRYVESWPSFVPLATSQAGVEQIERDIAAASRFVDRRFADDPAVRDEVAAMLFAPTVERPTYYGQRTYTRRAS